MGYAVAKYDYDEMGNAVGPVFHKIRVYRLWVVVLAALSAAGLCYIIYIIYNLYN